ncbi:hypothetical protein M422DRAFT_215649 [Sphaerobolus stellatus SS14]|uniref:Uncharacterized protein n=1 Tax=Sphaerobolus stellatus (strain SS14) TaxID=990650 RepID=A0A0C9TEX1_SPHS4|nr:hypothetical protein M422DRAFT_215649 [Sphaerobolus stellatus SS14]
MSHLTAVNSLAETIKKPLKISSTGLRKYSWLPDVLRIRGSVLTRIIGPVLTVTIFATIIAVLFEKGYDVTLTNSVTPLLAVVVGLLLVFRNSTSYDRYYEGRKDFGAMMSTIRNLSRLIWVNVNHTATPGLSSSTTSAASDDKTLLTSSNLLNEKVKTLKLLLSYAFSVKHHLRGEDGVDWPDYKDVLPPSFTRFDQIGYDRTVTRSYSSVSLRGRNKKTRVAAAQIIAETGSSTPLLTDSYHTVEFHPYPDHLSLPLPMVIAHEVTRLLYKFKRSGYLEVVGPAGTNAMMQLCASLSDQLTAMERIANTPIPSFYGVHLKQCVTLYLCALPSTLVKDLGWKMIPIVTVVAITLMGIEGIADEIEMPFGTDQCDLPLDHYCAELKNEIEYVIARLPQGMEDEDAFVE